MATLRHIETDELFGDFWVEFPNGKPMFFGLSAEDNETARPVQVPVPTAKEEDERSRRLSFGADPAKPILA